METRSLPEYQGYNVPDIARCLAENGIKWNRMSTFKDENGTKFVKPAQIDYYTHDVERGESKDFGFIHASSFVLQVRYKGKFIDLTQQWVEYLAKNKSRYIEYNKSYLAQEEKKWEKYKVIFPATDERTQVIERNLKEIKDNKEKISLAELVRKMEV